jgi:hypothetical protein
MAGSCRFPFSLKLLSQKWCHASILNFLSVRQLCAGPILVSCEWRQHVTEQIRRMFMQHLVLSVELNVLEYDESFVECILSAKSQMKVNMPAVTPSGGTPDAGFLRSTMSLFTCTYRNERYKCNIKTYSDATEHMHLPCQNGRSSIGEKNEQPLISVCVNDTFATVECRTCLAGTFEWLLQGDNDLSQHFYTSGDNAMHERHLHAQQHAYAHPRYHSDANNATPIRINDPFRCARAAHQMDLAFTTTFSDKTTPSSFSDTLGSLWPYSIDIHLFHMKVDVLFMTYKIPLAGMAAWIQHVLRYWAPTGCYERFLEIVLRVGIAHVVFSEVRIFSVAQLLIECAAETMVTWPARFDAAEKCLVSMFITEQLPLPLLTLTEDSHPYVWWSESVQSCVWSNLLPAVFQNTTTEIFKIQQKMRKHQRHVQFVKSLMQKWTLPYPIPHFFLAHHIYANEKNSAQEEDAFMKETALKYEHCLRADFFFYTYTDYFHRYAWSTQMRQEVEADVPYRCINERLEALQNYKKCCVEHGSEPNAFAIELETFYRDMCENNGYYRVDLYANPNVKSHDSR